MKITDVKIRRMSDESKMKAIVSVTFDDELVIHDIKIIQGHDRMFLAMPSRRLPDGGYSDIAHPTRKELRNEIEAKVLIAFENYLNGEMGN
ncbi:MAG: septation regulator SpoVG [Oscillospiraceae bacterium]|nr:septation regulator SpoVG [Oscillospiraceae bacterium]MBQ6847119.1 septation regulator SpoVG [Oscillospiraceae bacterium]MBQ7118958.1 septation regulator SpoVG [Oscillospiraceae bacterium]